MNDSKEDRREEEEAAEVFDIAVVGYELEREEEEARSAFGTDSMDTAKEEEADEPSELMSTRCHRLLKTLRA